MGGVESVRIDDFLFIIGLTLVVVFGLLIGIALGLFCGTVQGESGQVNRR